MADWYFLTRPLEVTLTADVVRGTQPVDHLCIEVGQPMDADPIDVCACGDGFDFVKARVVDAAVQPEADLQPALHGLTAGTPHACHEGYAVVVRYDGNRAERLDDFLKPI